MVENEVGEFNDFSLFTCFLTSQKHSFGVHPDKSPKIYTRVEQIFMYKTGLLLNIYKCSYVIHTSIVQSFHELVF